MLSFTPRLLYLRKEPGTIAYEAGQPQRLSVAVLEEIKCLDPIGFRTAKLRVHIDRSTLEMQRIIINP